MRLRDKIAIIVGAGQSPGEGMGNGRATVLRFTQEGAKVLAVDNNLSSAEATAAHRPAGQRRASKAAPGWIRVAPRAWGATADEVPSLAEARPALERIFAEHGRAGGVTVRYRRYIWRAIVPD